MSRQRLLEIYRMPLSLMAFIVAFDQWTKVWALDALAKPGGIYHQQLGWANSPDGHYVVFESWFWFRYAENRAAAFSLTQSIPEWFRMPMLIGVTLIAIGGVLYWLYKLEAEQQLLRIALGLVLGGAIGNLIDRAGRGFVVDFIDWHLRRYDEAGLCIAQCNWTFPTFNIADSAVVCGGALILLFGGKTAAADVPAPKDSAERFTESQS